MSRIGSGNYDDFPQLEVSTGKILLSTVIEIKKFAGVTAVPEW